MTYPKASAGETGGAMALGGERHGVAELGDRPDDE